MKYEDIELNVCVSGEDEGVEEMGLDSVEQELSLARACKAELQLEFVGIPVKSSKEMTNEYENERIKRMIPEWESKRIQAFGRKMRLESL